MLYTLILPQYWQSLFLLTSSDIPTPRLKEALTCAKIPFKRTTSRPALLKLYQSHIHTSKTPRLTHDDHLRAPVASKTSRLPRDDYVPVPPISIQKTKLRWDRKSIQAVGPSLNRTNTTYENWGKSELLDLLEPMGIADHSMACTDLIQICRLYHPRSIGTFVLPL